MLLVRKISNLVTLDVVVDLSSRYLYNIYPYQNRDKLMLLAKFRSKKKAEYRPDVYTKAVLPALDREYTTEDIRRFEASLERAQRALGHDNVAHTTITVKKLHLESIMLTSSKPSPYFIIHCRGNGEFMQTTLDECLHDVLDTGCNALAFNYPGVNGSALTELDAQVLVNSVVGIVNHLRKDQKVKPENILLKGHSLGAAIAILAASQCHQKGQKVSVFAGRTFASLLEFMELHRGLQIKAKIFPAHQEKWQMNVLQAYLSIPNGFKTCVNAAEDNVIPLQISLLLAVAKHQDSEPDAERVFTCTNQLFSAHGAMLDFLSNHHSQTGHQFFLDFVASRFILPDVKDIKHTV